MAAWLDRLRATFEGIGSKPKDKHSVNATLAMIALVAGADGEIEPAERSAAAQLVRGGALFEGVNREEINTTLEAYFVKSTNEILKDDLYAVMAKCKGTDYARSLIKLGIKIAGADGVFEPQEKEVLREACTVLAVNAGDFPGLS